jgi:hypothetical protein
VIAAADGGVTHFALAPDEDDGGVMTIAFGQGATNGASVCFSPDSKDQSITTQANSASGQMSPRARRSRRGTSR